MKFQESPPSVAPNAPGGRESSTQIAPVDTGGLVIGGTMGTALFSTTTLVSVTLPVFRTVPLKVKRPPGLVGATGQFSVTAMPGAVTNGQVAEAVLEMTFEAQLSVPLALTEALTEQASNGVVKLTVKLAEPPGARVGTVNTVAGEAWLLVTVTLFRVTLPGLLTVPV